LLQKLVIWWMTGFRHARQAGADISEALGKGL